MVEEQNALRADLKQCERLNSLTLDAIQFYNFLCSKKTGGDSILKLSGMYLMEYCFINNTN